MREKVDAVRTGEFLAALRRSRGLTQEQVAEALCVSNKTISKWESGSGLPDITILPDLAEFYHVTADDVLAGRRLQSAERTVETRQKQQQRQSTRSEMKLVTLGHRLILLVSLVMVLCLRSDWALWVENWDYASQVWDAVTRFHFGHLLLVIVSGLLFLLLHYRCKRAGEKLLGPVGSWVFGVLYGVCFLFAGSTFGASLCRSLLYSDGSPHSYKEARRMIARITDTCGPGRDLLLLVFVIGFALYTIFRLEEDPRK